MIKTVKRAGCLLAIEGIDGSGKTVQSQLLLDKLVQHNYPAKLLDFPQYGKRSAGLVENYLNGLYGSPQQVGAYRAAIFYACDRYDASFQLRQDLYQGKIIVANRYVASNLAHQGGKLAEDQRQQFFDWLEKLEYDIFQIPRPSLTVILQLPVQLAWQLVGKKAPRAYLAGAARRDQHEADLQHLQQAAAVYQQLAQRPGYLLIDCAPRQQLLSATEIHRLIWKKVSPLLNQ